MRFFIDNDDLIQRYLLIQTKNNVLYWKTIEQNEKKCSGFYYKIYYLIGENFYKIIGIKIERYSEHAYITLEYTDTDGNAREITFQTTKECKELDNLIFE